jgi:SAM-dependent methyltransferase
MDTADEKAQIEIAIMDRISVIRSDRREFIGIKSELEFEFGTFEVSNYSATGIAIHVSPQADCFFKSRIYTAVHTVDGVKVGTYELCVARKERLESGDALQIGFEHATGSVPTTKIGTVVKIRKVLNEFTKSQREIARIPPEFRRLTLEARLFLLGLEEQVEQMHTEKKLCSLQELQSFEQALIPAVSELIWQWFEHGYDQLGDSLIGVPESDLPICLGFFREQLKGLIYQSPFSYRSMYKPLGYAGDFEMMNILYRNESVGQSMFGKCLHAYWMSHPEAKAVRNRSRYLYGHLSRMIRECAGVPLKIASIACGPAREVQMLVETSHTQHLDLSNCDFYLLDQDVNALKHAHESLWDAVKGTNSPVKLNFINKSTRHVITRGWKENDFDLIYSAGLFDYFSDPVARMAAKALFDRLKPGASLIIGNFNSTTPNQNMMRLALDWSLIYRGVEDLQRLYGDMGGEVTVEQEPEGVNLFCVIRKPLAN